MTEVEKRLAEMQNPARRLGAAIESATAPKKLKPCPFCGSEAKYNAAAYLVECSDAVSCGAYGRPGRMRCICAEAEVAEYQSRAKSEAIKWWNRRAPLGEPRWR